MNSSVVRRLISHSQRHRASERSQLAPLLHSHFFSAKSRLKRDDSPPTAATPKPGFPRPTDILFQSKVSNLVNLSGYVQSPVQFQTTPDGSCWAAAVITQNVSPKDHADDDGEESPDSLPLWVPVIFEGDLAHTAASHIKENDRVHVTGRLSSSLPHVIGSQVQASVKVMVNDINFIEKRQVKILTALPSVTMESKNVISNITDSKSKGNNPDFSVWRDVIDNPNEWFDNRDGKKNRTLSPKYPDFKRKDGSHVLWLSRAPKSLLPELHGLEFAVQIPKPKKVTQSKGSDDKMLDSWEDLVNKTKEWRDYRNSKLNGQVHPKHPDFKRMDGTGQALWLNSAPQWFLSKLEGLEFDDVQVQNSKEVKDGKGVDELWKDIVENPDHWWDKRVGKSNTRAPDFKHKKTGEALWIDRAPAWALSKLPATKTMENTTKWNR